MVRVLVTGASGLLGRSVMRELRKDGALGHAQGERQSVDLEGWSFSRPGLDLVSVDLTQPEHLTNAFTNFHPDIVVHCAAERKPDSIGKEPGKAAALNAAATALLADLLAKSGSQNPLFLYISTDYVFDGKEPPYAETAVPNPINDYGRLKLEGEKKTEARSKNWAILRVPILYGPVEYVGEGAVDVLLMVLQSGAAASVDDLQRRFPTHTAQVARAVAFLLFNHLQKPGSVAGIYHFSGEEEMSKYEMVVGMGRALGLPSAHVHPNHAPPTDSPLTVQRPLNAHLENNRLKDLGFQPHPNQFFTDVAELYSHFLHPPNNP